MFQDRRVYPRQKESLSLRVALPDGEATLVTTDIGPTGAFFAGSRRLEPGTLVDVLVRPVGLKIAPVRLHAEVVRVVPVGGTYPPGFAVRWLWALSEAGGEPVFQVLRKVLHIQGIREEHLEGGRRVRFDFPPAGAKFQLRTSSAVERAPDPGALPRGAGFREEVVSTGARVHAGVAPPRAVTRTGARSTGPTDEATSQPAIPSFAPAPTLARNSAASAGAALPASLSEADDQEHTPTDPYDPGGSGGETDSLLDGLSMRQRFAAGTEGVDRQRVSGAWSTWRRTSDVVDSRRRTSDVHDSDDLRPLRPRSREPDADPALGTRTHDKPRDDSPFHNNPRSAASADGQTRRMASGHFDPAAQLTRTGATLGPGAASRDLSVVFDAASEGDRTTAAAGTGRPAATGRGGPAAQDARLRSDVVGSGLTGASTRRAQSGRFTARQGSDPARRSGEFGESPFMERSQIFGRGGQLTTNLGLDARSQQTGAHAPVEIDLPVTYEFDGRLVPARLVSAASLAVELITRDFVPAVDERLVVNLPVDIDGRWRTVSLHGKLLRVPVPRDDGSVTIIVAIERVHEGSFAGAYAQMLRDVQGEAGP